MHRKIFVLLAICVCLSAEIFVNADCDHRSGKTHNLLFPNLQIQITPPLLNKGHLGYSLIGEFGEKNLRGNATLGFKLNSTDSCKLSAEYLTQRLEYNFYTGKIHQWMHQMAIGLALCREFNYQWIKNIEVSGFYSRAPSKYLSPKLCSDVGLTLWRNIAGSNAYGTSIGATILPWKASSIFIQASYDQLFYHLKYDHKKQVSGLGATIDFNQKLTNNWNMQLKGEFRRPFDYYKAVIYWDIPKWQGLRFSLYSSYTKGKKDLPNNISAGLQLSYMPFEQKTDSKSAKSPLKLSFNAPDTNSKFITWISNPVVYLPEVLAIAERIKGNSPGGIRYCPNPKSYGIPNITIIDPSYIINLTPFFSNPAENEGKRTLTYSAAGLPNGSIIDPSTGYISGTNPAYNTGDTSLTITVTASNICGSTSQTFLIHYVSAP